MELDAAIKQQCRESFDKGIQCILDTQIKKDGVRTVWCAQHDAVTLQPVKARAYELPSFSGDESAGIVLLLMSIPHPSAEVIAAVKGAVAWYDLDTGKPFFCDRDGIKRENLNDIGKERRGGYSWYTSSPSKVLKYYTKWLKKIDQ